MSHFTVVVFGDNHEALLAPFNEGIDVAPRREYMDALDYNRFVNHYRQKNHTFDGAHDHPEFDEYAKEWNGRGIIFDGDPPWGKPYELTTYNPASKWDWYEVGGRWDGNLKIHLEEDDDGEHRTCSQADFYEIDWDATEPPFAFVTVHGEWIEKAKMGWWAITTDEDASRYEYDWKRQLKMTGPDVKVTLVDCHI